MADIRNPYLNFCPTIVDSNISLHQFLFWMSVQHPKKHTKRVEMLYRSKCLRRCWRCFRGRTRSSLEWRRSAADIRFERSARSELAASRRSNADNYRSRVWMNDFSSLRLFTSITQVTRIISCLKSSHMKRCESGIAKEVFVWGWAVVSPDSFIDTWFYICADMSILGHIKKTKSPFFYAMTT